MGAKRKITGRYFIVGCARSGTTLLQAMLAGHSRVFSFPESHFFCSAVPQSRRLRLLGFANLRTVQSALSDLLTSLERRDLASLIPGRNPLLSAYGRAFRCIIDQATRDRGKDIWLEKTPHHIDYLTSIQRVIPNARFIHILRDGRDVIASQRHAISQDPAYWGSWGLPQLVQVWNKDVQTSLRYRHQPAHILISYEALLDRPLPELERLCTFLQVDFQLDMLRHWEMADVVLGGRRSHPWMQSAFEPLKDTRLKKFFRVFTVEERQFIESHLLWGGRVGDSLDAVVPQRV